MNEEKHVMCFSSTRYMHCVGFSDVCIIKINYSYTSLFPFTQLTECASADSCHPPAQRCM